MSVEPTLFVASGPVDGLKRFRAERLGRELGLDVARLDLIARIEISELPPTLKTYA